MDPRSLRATGLGRFPDLQLAVPHGTTALVGPNGAGKSTLLNCVEVALFADGSRDLAPLLGPWADRLELELIFDHDGQTFRVIRGYKRSGRGGTATLDLHQHVDGRWAPLTMSDAKSTQALLCDLLGLSRRTFRASSFLAQGDAGAFTEASPSERKAIIGEVLDPHGVWPALTAAARDRARTVEAELAATVTRIADREQFAADLPSLSEQLAAATAAATDAETTLAAAMLEHERARETVAKTEAAADRHRAAQQAVRDAQAAVDRAREEYATVKEHADQLPAARARLAELHPVAATVPLLEQQAQAHRDLAAKAEQARAAKAAADRAMRQQAERVHELRAQHRAITDRLEHLAAAGDGTERCHVCAQLLGAEARRAALQALQTDAHRAAADLATAEQLSADLEFDWANITIPDVPESAAEAGLAAAREAADEHARLDARIPALEQAAGRLETLTLEGHALAEELELRTQALDALAATLGESTAAAEALARARTALERARSQHHTAATARTRVEEHLAFAQQAADDVKTLKASIEPAQKRLDLLRLAEKAYGRDGIPALLAENVIPQVEAEANRILQLMPTADGAVFTVALETLRALKTDAARAAETLDIVVMDDTGSRPYETYSGGERARLNIALRIALARLLAGRRGAESRLLAIDELEYLDLLGQGQLVDVVKSVAGSFDRVLVVSHADVLRDAFDHVIELEKRDGVSALAGAEVEAVAA